MINDNREIGMTDFTGVHQTHCCIIHGCKYCDRDCPVATGKVIQSYNCEDCQDYFNPTVTHTFEVQSNTFNQLVEKKRTYFVHFPTGLGDQINRGDVLFFNEVNSNMEPTGAKETRVVSLVTTGLEEGLSDNVAILAFDRD